MTSINSPSPSSYTPKATEATPKAPEKASNSGDFMKGLGSIDTPQTSEGLFTKDSVAPWIGQNGEAIKALDLDFDLGDMSYKMTPEEAQRMDDLIAENDSLKFKFKDPRRIEFSGDYGEKMQFFNDGISSEKALFSLEARMPTMEQRRQAENDHMNDPFGDYNVPVGKPKIRSPWAKQMLRNAGDNLIKNPLEAAWDNKDFTSSDSLKAMGWTTALVAAAIASPSDIKSSVKLADTDFGGYNIGLKSRLRSGDGKVDMSSVGLQFKPEEQKEGEHWRSDLKYDFEDDRTTFSFSKTIQKGSHRLDPRTDIQFNIYSGDEKTNDDGNRTGGKGINFSIHRSF